jgi:putative nucleotidyltransferase with HDIG domain
VIGALAAALDARDPYTAGHSQRVSDLSVLLALEMELPEQDRETLRLGALLHDIGKIGISDSVLRKPGKLTAEEFDHIKMHPVLGARILRPATFLESHLPVVELHHERPDGRGYPHGLRGEEIPLFARIVHVADAFDAMTSARAYRPARPAADAMAELWRNVGTDFDPRVVQAMAAVWDTKLVSTPARPRQWRRPSAIRSAPRCRSVSARRASLRRSADRARRGSGRRDDHWRGHVDHPGYLARGHFHLRHGRCVVRARHPRYAAGDQLLRPERRHDGEFVGVDVRGAIHHAVILSWPACRTNPRSTLRRIPDNASASHW